MESNGFARRKANLGPQSIITELNVYFTKLDGGTYVKAKLQSIRKFFNVEEIAAVWDFFGFIECVCLSAKSMGSEVYCLF